VARAAGHQEAILRAATKLFHERGFSRTTTDAIAAEAQITKRTLYRYFDSKEALLLAIHEQLLGRLLEPVDLHGTPLERFEALIKNYVDTAIVHRDQIRVFFEERKNLTPESLARVIARLDEHEKLFRETIIEGMATGQFRQLDVAPITEGVLGAVAGMYQWYNPSGWLAPKDIAKVLSTLFSQGLADAAKTPGPSAGRQRRSSRAANAEASAVVVGAEKFWSDNPVLIKILDAAGELFCDKGYDNTNTRELADAVGLTKSALYYYIPNKEAILFQLNLRLAAQGLEAVRDIISRTPGPAEAIRAIMIWQCRTVADNLGALRSLSYEMRFLDRPHYEQIESLRAEYSRLFISTLQASCPEWTEPELSRPIGLAILSMLNFMNEWYTTDSQLTPEQLGEGFFTLVRDGIVNRASGASGQETQARQVG
jgi:AcrR family transcriptional regulator